jgi:hypothetical protein
MTIPHNFPGSNVHMGPPKGGEENCGWLHIFSNGVDNVSAWKPSVEMLAKLNAGESIFVTVQSGSKIVEVEGEQKRAPIVFPMFVGSEDECKQVVGNMGEIW